MSGFVDLHCHCIPGVDDGARSVDEGRALLRGLREAGFDEVVATPHMRPGLFDNRAPDLVAAFDRFLPEVTDAATFPKLSLSSEHYFNDVVFERLLTGQGLPYPGGRAVLLEFYEVDFLPAVADRLFDLRRRRLLPVIAHPERYRCLWKSHERLASLVASGAVALLDIAALVGKYGKEPERCARRLLGAGLYHAACSDAHRPDDLAAVRSGIRHLEKKYGVSKVDSLFRKGPREILAGTVDA